MESARAFKVLLIFLFFGCGISNGQYTFIRNLSNGLNGIYGGAFARATNGDYLFNASINNNNLVLLRTDSNGIKIYETLISQLPYNKVMITDTIQNGDFFLHIVNDQSFTSQPAASVITDSAGNPASIKKHYLPGFSKFTVAASSPSGGIFLGGGIFDGNGTDTDMLLSRFDSSAESQWTISVSMPGAQVISTISPTYNGGCLITGTDSSGVNRYVIRFSATGLVQYAKSFTSANNAELRPVKIHAIDSLKDYMTADHYRILPTPELESCIIIKLNATGLVTYQKAFKSVNNNTSLFSPQNWMYQDPSGYVNLLGWSKFYNSGPGVYYDSPYYLKLNSTFGLLSSKSMPLFNCETSIVDVLRATPNEYVQVLSVKYHSGSQIEDATTFWKFDSAVNGCMNTTPITTYDTTFTMLDFDPFNTTLISHTMTDSVFALQGTIPCNYSVFSCIPAGENEIETPETLLAYPNPATEILHLDISANILRKMQYRIYTIQGKEIASGNSTNGEIDISPLTPQAYFLKLYSESETRSCFFIKSDK